MKHRTFLLRCFLLTVLFVGTSSFFQQKGKPVKNQPDKILFPEVSFKENDLNFLIIGDWGAGGVIQKNVATNMEKTIPKDYIKFVVSTGDNFYPSGVTSTTDNQWKTKFHNVYKGELQNIKWYVVLGNHDYGLNPQAQVEYSNVFTNWVMPNNYYTFSKTIDNTTIDFFCIDTQLLIKGSKEEKDKQLQWLEKELSESKALWKICVGHHMIRSGGVYGDQSFMMRTIKPLLDKYGVHLYLSGHDHDLQLIKASDDHFYQLISGAGGGARETGYGKNTLFAHTNGGYVSCSISNKNIQCKFYNQHGVVVFTHKIK
jgi:tartrate-resistant acid phosphatase type 5